MPIRHPSRTLALVLAVMIFPSNAIAKTAQEIARDAFPATVVIVMVDEEGTPVSLGSGFFVGRSEIATNMHVLGDATRGYVRIVGDSNEHEIKRVVAVDRIRDLAILSIGYEHESTLHLATGEPPQVGDTVYVVGNPQGLEGTFSQGIVSALRDVDTTNRLIQITAPISPGSSGGPVLDEEGEVIGVSVGMVADGQNLNFAVPVDYLSHLFTSFIEPRPLDRAATAIERIVGSTAMNRRPLPTTDAPSVDAVLGYSIDLPVGWAAVDDPDAYRTSYMSPGGDVALQIIAVPSDPAVDATSVARGALDRLHGSGEFEAFSYNGSGAGLGNVSIEFRALQTVGWMVCVKSSPFDLILLGVSEDGTQDKWQDYILSAIDSVRLGADARYPGPISQYVYPFPATNHSQISVGFGEGNLLFGRDWAELNAAQAVVDREARMLSDFVSGERPMFVAAWRRFFRIIYADNYARVAPVADQIARALLNTGVPRSRYPNEILSWIQGFHFKRPGGVSDLLPPVACIATESGDGDTYALTYVTILSHLGFDGIIMVSDVYGHAVAAVDAPGSGARFPFDGRNWLVAELSADVSIGQIPASMTDVNQWIGVNPRRRDDIE